MKTKVILNVLLLLCASFFLFACGGGGGDSSDGGGGNVTFANTDLVGTWHEPSMGDLVVIDTLIATMTDNPMFSGKISVTETGAVTLKYLQWNLVDFSTINGTWTGTMNAAKNQLTFTHSTWTKSDGTSGNDALSLVFSRV
jgi:hypothetical protein